MTYSAFLLDFDYTLVDSSKGIVMCAQYAFECMGFQMTAEQITAAIGHTLPDTYRILTQDNDPAAGVEFSRLFRLKQVDVMTDNTRLFPEVPTFIEYAKQHDIRLAIVSTKTKRPIVELLQREGLQSHFEFIIALEDVENCKPHPESIDLSLMRMQLPSHHVLFVGDSVIDAGAAQNAGVDFAATLTGRTERSEFHAYPHQFIANDLSELLDDTGLLFDRRALTEVS